MSEHGVVGDLSVGKVLRIAGRAYRRWFWRISLTAAVVFGLAAVLTTTLPAFIEGFIQHAVHAAFGLERFWGYVLVSAVVGSVVGAFVGLMEVIIARELTILWPRPS